MLLANPVWGKAAHIYHTKTPNGLIQQWVYDKKNGRTPMIFLRNEVVTIICV